jgi:hypothetical protein
MSENAVVVRLQHATDPSQTAWVAVQATRADEARQVMIDIDPAAAVKRDATSFLHPLTDAQAKVIKSEMVGGILMARKQLGGPGLMVRLLFLGGAQNDEARVSAIPSVAFAVAAHMGVVHLLGSDDERRELRGGFGWKLVSCDAV